MKISKTENNITGIKRDRNIKTILIWTILMLFILGEVIFLSIYLYRSTTAIQLMDFWLDSAKRLEMWKEGNVTLKELFPFPHSLHMSYLGGIVFGIITRLSNCDNRAWIYTGLIVRTLIIIILVWYVSKQKIFGENKWFSLIGGVLTTLPVINLNQWEIFTYVSTVSFNIRILLFFLVFFLIDHIAVRNEIKNRLLITTVLFGGGSLFFAGSAYMYGAYGAICVVLFIDFLCKKKISRILPYSLIIGVYTVVVVVYYVTLIPSATSSSPESAKGLMEIIYNFGEGLLLMMGAILVPLDTKPYIPFTNIVGLIILFFTIFAIFLFYRIKMWKTTVFPMLCIFYSLFSMIVIIYGRAWSFGLRSVSSSRYVVETTILLIGILIIFIRSITEFSKNKKYIIIIFSSIIVCMLTCGIIYANYFEWQRAPYIQGYYKRMIAYAYDLDYTTDEELKIFQSNPKDVRAGLKTMQRYKMGIYSDKCIAEYAELKPQRHNDYQTGQVISFDSDGQDAEFFFVKGVSAAEGGFTWTSDNYVNLTLCFSDETIPQSDMLNFVISYVAIYGDKQKVEIRVNGVDVGMETLKGSGEVSIPIVNRFKTGRNEIGIYLPDAFSPSESGGNDIRILGMALKSIVIEDAEKNNS